MYTGHLDKPTSKKEIQDNTKEDSKNEHVTKAAPFGDINLPKDIDIMNPISGKNINNKYINYPFNKLIYSIETVPLIL
jgi:hypothetical protein